MRVLAQSVFKLNEYHENFNKEVKPHLDQLCADLFIEYVHVESNGCEDYVVRKAVKYLEDHGMKVTWEEV